MKENALLLVAPLVGILYSVGEHFRIWDNAYFLNSEKVMVGVDRQAQRSLSNS